MKLKLSFKSISNLNMRGKILVIFAPVFACFLLSVSIIYMVMSDALRAQLMTSSFQTLMTVSNDLTVTLESLEDAVQSLIRSAPVQEYYSTEIPLAEKYSKRAILTRLVTNEANTIIPYAQGIYLIKDESEYIYIERNPYMNQGDIAEFAAYMYESNNMIYAARYEPPMDDVDYEQHEVLNYVIPMPNLNIRTITDTMLVVVRISPSVVTNVFRKYYDVAEDDGVVFAVSEYGGELVSSMPSGLDELTYLVSFDETPDSGYYVDDRGSQPYFVMNRRISHVNWVITAAIPLGSVLAPLEPYQTALIIIIAVSMVIFVLFIFITTSGMSSRLREMMGTIENVRRGDMGSRFPVRYRDEISRIGSEINNMLDNIQHLRLNIAELNLRQREAELKALQSQINPHFLYNTLESLRMSVLESGNTDIADQIQTLAGTFRYTIGPSVARTKVRIRSELEHVHGYLRIQGFRFGERYGTSVDVEPGIMDYLIVKLILQPIVENAFAHGVRGMRRGGRISLTGRLDGEHIVFEVSDNGAGIEPETLRRLRADMAAGIYDERATGSIGLINVNDRLRLNYGEQYGLEIESAVGEGTTVRLRFPAEAAGARPAD